MRGDLISADEVRRIAGLARLALTEREVEQMTVELGAILEYVSRLAELELPPGVPEQNAAGDLSGDEAHAPLGTRAALSGAPLAERGHFAVPRVIAR